MNTRDAIGAATDALWANPLRSALTALGIVIGVAAVVAMVAIGNGARAQVAKVLGVIGPNMLIISNGSRTALGHQVGRGQVLSLTEGDVDAIRRQIPGVALVAGSASATAHLVHGNRNWATRIHGVTPAYLVAHNWQMATGRPLHGEDMARGAKVVLLGRSVVTALFGGQDPGGATLRIGGVPFTVIGELAAKGTTPWGRDLDDTVLVPLTAARSRLLGTEQARRDFVDEITVRAVGAKAVPAVAAATSELLRQRHRLAADEPDDFQVSNIAEIAELRTASTRTLTQLLAAVAAIAMLVGGIGIMNTMLVSVTQRTREIGLRRALGARQVDVQQQFVIEAVLLTMAGGLVGALVGAAAAGGVAMAVGWPVLVTPGSLLLAVLFSGAVGLIFGWLPARRAARLDPITALRTE